MLANEQLVLGAALITAGAFVWLQFLARNKVDLFWYLLPFASFRIPAAGQAQPYNVNSQTLVLQNLGRKPVEECEVVLSRRVREFEIRVEPARRFTEATLVDGSQSYSFGTLGRNEILLVSFLFSDALTIIQVGHKDGIVAPGPLLAQRQAPRRVLWLVGVLILAGIFFTSLIALLALNSVSPSAVKLITDYLTSAVPKPPGT